MKKLAKVCADDLGQKAHMIKSYVILMTFCENIVLISKGMSTQIYFLFFAEKEFKKLKSSYIIYLYHLQQ